MHKYYVEKKEVRAFSVHDAILNENGLTLTHKLFETQLADHHIVFTPLRAGESTTFDHS